MMQFSYSSHVLHLIPADESGSNKESSWRIPFILVNFVRKVRPGLLAMGYRSGDWTQCCFDFSCISYETFQEEATPRRSLSVTSGDLYSPSVRFFFPLLLLGPMPMRNGGGGGDAARGRFDQLCVEKHKTKYSSFHLQGPRFCLVKIDLTIEMTLKSQKLLECPFCSSYN